MSFNTSLSGLDAAAGNLDAIANNIANASTTGFKKSRVEFADVYANASGGSGKTTGSGVLLKAVSQQFTQGQIAFTSNNLDLAISGEGFFVLDNNGAVSYSRAGAFGVDNQGYIANSSGEKLIGFLADNTGRIGGARDGLRITTNNLAPLATSNIEFTLNMDSSAMPPSVDFVPGFTKTTPPAPDTYNSSTSTTIYDSLGNSHILTSYFVKAHAENTWRVYLGVDGTDITPTEASIPGGSIPAPYPTAVAKPYTVVFDKNGQFVPHTSTSLTKYYGPESLNSILSPVGPIDLKAGATLPRIVEGDLVLNGVHIPEATLTADRLSTAEITGSAISIADSINRTTNRHGVTATPDTTTFTLGSVTSTFPCTLATGDLVINGSSVVGAGLTNNAAVLAAINALTAVTGITAAGSPIVLSAADGRNIRVESTGSSSTTLSSFNVGGGSALDQIQRATMTLTSAHHEGLEIGGTNPSHAGLSVGRKYGIIYDCSDLINITAWDPGTGAANPQAFAVDLSTATQFGAPFSVEALHQNGYSTGRLASVDVTSTGVIYARYSNGQSLALGQVALANFRNTQGLSPLGNSAWGETFNSGAALVGSPGTSSFGSIQAGALEDSNVDLSNELVSLIVAQRNFQANAQTIRTDDAVTQTIINIR